MVDMLNNLTQPNQTKPNHDECVIKIYVCVCGERKRERDREREREKEEE